MRVFVAGASGVIGIRLVPLLVEAGHLVAGMTRTPAKMDAIREQGAEPVLVDVFEAEAVGEAVIEFGPEMIIHQLTDLPDDAQLLSGHTSANARIRREGTANLLAAGAAAGSRRFLAQSVAFELRGEAGEAVRAMEDMVVGAGGVILRYGLFYGPGTYHPKDLPDPPRVHIDQAARATMEHLMSAPGVFEVVDPMPDAL